MKAWHPVAFGDVLRDYDGYSEIAVWLTEPNDSGDYGEDIHCFTDTLR